MQKAFIYTTPTCHFCQMAKAYFKENNVEYEEYNVATDMAKRTEMIQKSGQMGVPVIQIGNNLVIGFNKPIISKLLELPA